MRKIRVLIADDHPLVRAGLASLLESDPLFQVVAETSDGEETVARVEALRPDVAILDVNMPRLSGIEATRKIRDAGLATAVVLLSMHREPSFVRAGLQAGACGYVLKEADSGEVLAAVHAAARRDVYLSRRVAQVSISSGASGPVEPELTPRERDVLRLLAEGLTTKEIAARLDIGVRTVDTHRVAVMDKLDIRNVPGLVKYAIRNHLVELDG